MKKIIPILALVFLMSQKTYANEINLKINNKKIITNTATVKVDNAQINTEYSPYTLNGRTFVPIRELTESLGAKVDWDTNTKSATVNFGNMVVKLKIDSSTVYINDNKKNIEVNSIPKFVLYPNGETKTMVPLRFLSETLGFNVSWEESTKTAFINTTKQIEEKEPKSVSIEEDDKEIKKDKQKTEENNAKNSAGVKTSSLSNAKANSEPIKESSGTKRVSFISNIEKNETNKLNQKDEKDLYTSAGLDINEVNKLEEQKVTRTLKAEGKLTVVIDPGHGGIDSGAIVSSGLTEKELNIKVAKKLKEKLEDSNIEVIITRDSDEYIKLVDRTAMANDSNAELFLSIHFNSSDNRNARGIESLYANEKNVKIKSTIQSYFAQELQNALIKATNSPSRGIKNRPDLVVLNKTKGVAALVELGFMSNPEDYLLITNDEYLDKLVDGLFNGINNYSDKYIEFE